MTTTDQRDQERIGARIARHAAAWCAYRLDFRSATLIAQRWGYHRWPHFTTLDGQPVQGHSYPWPRGQG